MWRRAHGRLAAIVVLAGGLSSCMPPPTRSPSSRRALDDEERGEHLFHCGTSELALEADQEEAARSPQQWRATLVQWLEGTGLGCQTQIEYEPRFGEIRVTVNREREVAVDARGRGTLTQADRDCVEAAAREVVQKVTAFRNWKAAALDEPLTAYVEVGKSPPLFPTSDSFVTDWLAALRTKAARRHFQAQLPAEVVLEDDGCLAVPRRTAFKRGLGLWLSAQTPIDAFWQASGPGPEGILDGRPHGFEVVRRAYWLGEHAALVHRDFADEDARRMAVKYHKLTEETARQEICLLPLDQDRRAAIRARIDQRGSCWVGDLGDILLHPRTVFPTDRLFKTVAVGMGRDCAIDDKGAITCCGARLPEDPPAQAFSAVAVGRTFDCGLTTDGGMRCWGWDAPAGGEIIPGPFQRIAVAGLDVCAVRRDTQTLECRRGKEARLPAFAPQRARGVAFMADGPCALLDDGRIFCVGSEKDVPRTIEGPFRAFAAGRRVACGVVAKSGREVRCWRVRDDLPQWTAVRGPDRSLLPGGDEAADVALSQDDACLLGRAGHVACWRDSNTKSWDGLYETIAGGANYEQIPGSAGRFCAITVDGRVECDHGWPR